MSPPAPLLMLLMLLMITVLVGGCNRDNPLPVIAQPGDAPVRATGSHNARTAALDALLTDIARHVEAVPTAAPPSAARLTVVEWGRFTNMTGAAAERFAQFRAGTQRQMAALAEPHNLLLTTDVGRGGITGFELQATVLIVDEADDTWLVQWALYGPLRDGGRGLVWQDETLLGAG